jgi:hypothetical protein
MKKLELNQMENLEGGANCNYGHAAMNVGLSGTSLIWAAATVVGAATNPAGWIFLGIAAASFYYNIKDC